MMDEFYWDNIATLGGHQEPSHKSRACALKDQCGVKCSYNDLVELIAGSYFSNSR